MKNKKQKLEKAQAKKEIEEVLIINFFSNTLQTSKHPQPDSVIANSIITHRIL